MHHRDSGHSHQSKRNNVFPKSFCKFLLFENVWRSGIKVINLSLKIERNRQKIASASYPLHSNILFGTLVQTSIVIYFGRANKYERWNYLPDAFFISFGIFASWNSIVHALSQVRENKEGVITASLAYTHWILPGQIFRLASSYFSVSYQFCLAWHWSASTALLSSFFGVLPPSFRYT